MTYQCWGNLNHCSNTDMGSLHWVLSTAHGLPLGCSGQWCDYCKWPSSLYKASDESTLEPELWLIPFSAWNTLIFHPVQQPQTPPQHPETIHLLQCALLQYVSLSSEGSQELALLALAGSWSFSLTCWSGIALTPGHFQGEKQENFP